VACTVFTPGCNLRCPYCHNPEILDPDLEMEVMPEENFFSFLDNRSGFLDGVCITGGEPTIQRDIQEFIVQVRERGFLVKLDTNGTIPAVLKELLEDKLLDYVAMDVKTSLEGYTRDMGFRGNTADIIKSIDMIKGSGIEYEFRTTVVPGLIDTVEILEVAKMIKGARRYFIQNFRPGYVLDGNLSERTGYPPGKLEEFRKILEPCVEETGIRN